ncbi:hypothetical protein DIPPA_29887 [Diplonema papillatum]|nr:hypothetical protein DIPPA_29887 [Diplonema papillatum]
MVAISWERVREEIYNRLDHVEKDAFSLQVVGGITVFFALVLLFVVYRIVRLIWLKFEELRGPQAPKRIDFERNEEVERAWELERLKKEQQQQQPHGKSKQVKGKSTGKAVDQKSSSSSKPAPSSNRQVGYVSSNVQAKDGIRKRTPSTNYVVVKGFKTPVVAISLTTADADGLLFVGSSDRTYRLLRASTLGVSNDFVQVRIEKATITMSAFDSTGRVLGLFLDNERKLKVYAVEFKEKDNVHLIWEYKLPAIPLTAIGIGPGGGYAILLDDTGKITVINRRGKELDSTKSSQGTVRQWAFNRPGSMLGMAASMSASCRIHAFLSGRNTLDDGALWEGVEVDCMDTGTNAWYPAKIVTQDADGTYTIDWLDGTLGYCTPRDLIRPKGVQTRGEDFGSMKHAMTLTGHKLGTTCIGFSPDNTHAVSCSEDGGIRVWNINVRWHLQEDPKLIHSFEDTDYNYFTHAAISPNNKILVLGTADTSLLVYRIDCKKPEIIAEISETHKGFAPFSFVEFTAKHVVTTAATSDSKVKTWNLAAKDAFRLEYR